MGKKWKFTIEAKKRKFLELYQAGTSPLEIRRLLGMEERNVFRWRDIIRVFGPDEFLMAHTSRKTYPYEIKLAAVKAHLEDQMPIRVVQARYGIVSFKALQSWCKIYREQGEAGLRPKRKGRPTSAKNKPKKELTYVEEMELRIRRLEAELAIAKKLAALKGQKH